MRIQFALEFEPLSALHGWMDCWLTVNDDRQHVDASSVFPPFREVLNFARAVAAEKFPHSFNWEEEGPWLEFKAISSAADPAKFRMVIDRNGKPVFDAELDRMETVRHLVEQLRRVALDCPGAESEWEFPYFLLEEFDRDLGLGLLGERPPARAGQTHVVFYQCGGYGGVEAPAFCLWIDNALSLPMMMDDIDRLWKMWFEMLKKIQGADFPFVYDFNRNLQPGDPEPAEEAEELMFWDSWYIFECEAADDSAKFRLKIAMQMPLEDERSDIGMVTLDRGQFVEAFVSAFKEFLQTDYLGFMENGMNRIDLRALPLEGLGG